jgi:hypothetical protein
MFAVNEGISALQSATGSQNAFTTAISQGASAVFGIKFALDAVGGSFAQLALPIGIVIGLYTALSQESKQLAEIEERLKQSQTPVNRDEKDSSGSSENEKI